MSTPPVPADEDGGDGTSIIVLDEAEGWALWLPDDAGEAVVVHGHGPEGETDEAEWLFVEVDAATDAAGNAVVRCPECSATVTEAQIDAWIAALPTTVLDEE